jgi:hypothetical protein
MKNLAASVGAAVALLLASAAFVAAMMALTKPVPRPTPMPPLGVCVMVNPNFADTTVVATVEQANRVNGVVSCEVGSYVPVVPK